MTYLLTKTIRFVFFDGLLFGAKGLSLYHLHFEHAFDIIRLFSIDLRSFTVTT